MLNGLRQKVIVQPGGIVEVRSPEFQEGSTVEVIVLLEADDSPINQGLSRFIGAAQGNFSSPEEVDQFIQQERQTWDS
jgi:hypothetical protein